MVRPLRFFVGASQASLGAGQWPAWGAIKALPALPERGWVECAPGTVVDRKVRREATSGPWLLRLANAPAKFGEGCSLWQLEVVAVPLGGRKKPVTAQSTSPRTGSLPGISTQASRWRATRDIGYQTLRHFSCRVGGNIPNRVSNAMLAVVNAAQVIKSGVRRDGSRGPHCQGTRLGLKK